MFQAARFFDLLGCTFFEFLSIRTFETQHFFVSGPGFNRVARLQPVPFGVL